MKKIVLVTNIPAPYRVDLFYYMQRHLKHYDIHIIYTNKSEDNRSWSVNEDKMLNSQILKSKIIKLKGGMDNRYIHLPVNIMKKLSEINPDAVVAWEYNPGALQSLMWCKINKKKFIHLTDGTLNSEKAIGRIQKYARKIIASNSDAFIASSTKAKEKLLAWGIKEEKIFVSLLTVDNTIYNKKRKKFDANNILYVGSLIKRKGLDLLIRTLPYINTEYKLRVVGNGTKKEVASLMKLSRLLGVEERIIWCGFKIGDDLAQEYNEAALFLLPTREDCFGLVLLEALYAGTPIVSSKYADGAYDIIEEEVNGFIVDPYNSKEVATVVNQILSDRNMQEKMSIACHTKISKFKFEEVAKGYREAFEYVLKKRQV